MTWGCQVLDWQQPDIMKKTNNEPMSALTEQTSEKNAQQGRKAKEIFLGIDAHVSRYLVARKLDGTAVQAAQSMSFEGLLVFAQKQLSLAKKSTRSTRPGRWATFCTDGSKPWALKPM